ncbi:afadin- and alpha-actinin-binding protein [Panicum miliaceum]|uniref:Afadin-and alpha-actinin-binding protein n=1 Tax=Panicum miliaceum TaxID=4540 RepID=A0A3L6RF45_PANMI|nr:afadin- and alpha-actinin-binding protein [Panicum miliaceum]
MSSSARFDLRPPPDPRSAALPFAAKATDILLLLNAGLVAAAAGTGVARRHEVSAVAASSSSSLFLFGLKVAGLVLNSDGGAPCSCSDGGAFANAGNLEHCARYLNQTLVTFGFPASLDLFATDPVSIARTCNCIYALLQQRQRDIEFRESTNDLRQRMQSDISRLEAKIERMDAQLAAKDRELATLTRTEAKNTAALKSQIDKLQQERDEFQKMVIGNQEKLNQVLMEKKKESSRSGMEIMNLLQKEGRQRGTWNGKKNDNDYYKMIVDAYEVKKQELMQENADLRALLRSMQCVDPSDNVLPQMDMREFLNAPNGSSQPTVAANGRKEAGSPQSPLGGKTDVFDLPFHMARDQIEESLRTKMASIKDAYLFSLHHGVHYHQARMTQLQDAQKGAEVTSEATDRELELEAQLVEARSIIQEQASIMSKHFTKSDKPSGRRHSGLDGEREVSAEV